MILLSSTLVYRLEQRALPLNLGFSVCKMRTVTVPYVIGHVKLWTEELLLTVFLLVSSFYFVVA